VTGVAPASQALKRLASEEGWRDPYAVYSDLFAGGKGQAWTDDGRLLVFGYDECLRALREQRLLVADSASHDHTHPGWREHPALRGFTNTMLYSNPPAHAMMRGLAVRAFSTHRVRALKPVVRELAVSLLDRMADLGAGGRSVDFMSEFAFRLPYAVIGRMLGVPAKDAQWIRALSARISLVTEGRRMLAGLDDADSSWLELAAYFAEHLRRRRRQPADDLISDMVQAFDRGDHQLTMDQLVGNLIFLLIAGFDTTTFLLGQGAAVGAERADLAAAVAAEPDLAAGYVEEVLRIGPPIQATSRFASTDLELGEEQLPRQTQVVLLLAAANRDPRYFDQPQRFDPGRSGPPPLSFGGGMHLCLGATLARMEASVALPLVFSRFPRISAAASPVPRRRWIVRGYDGFLVRLD
jgi:cytochrome P450